jgi:hypothetical protein
VQPKARIAHLERIAINRSRLALQQDRLHALGVNDQAAWVVDGFAVLAGVEAVMGQLPAISKTE